MSIETPEVRSHDEQREEHRRLRAEHVTADYFKAHPDFHLARKVADGSLSMDDAAVILHESARDPKTDVQRADLLQLTLEYETYLARENDEPLTVAIVDIDNFKKINEELTHVGADDVLRDVAKDMVATLRESDDLLPLADQDAMTRWGGEEFVVVLTGVTVEQGHEAAERLRARIEEHLSGRRPDGQPITVSIGLSQYDRSTHTDVSSFLKEADEQLLAAKAAGKNRVFPELSQAA